MSITKKCQSLIEKHEQSIHQLKIIQYYEWLSHNGIKACDVMGVRILPNEKGWAGYRERCERIDAMWMYNELKRNRYRSDWVEYIVRDDGVVVLPYPPFPDEVVYNSGLGKENGNAVRSLQERG